MPMVSLMLSIVDLLLWESFSRPALSAKPCEVLFWSSGTASLGRKESQHCVGWE